MMSIKQQGYMYVLKVLNNIHLPWFEDGDGWCCCGYGQFEELFGSSASFEVE